MNKILALNNSYGIDMSLHKPNLVAVLSAYCTVLPTKCLKALCVLLGLVGRRLQSKKKKKTHISNRLTPKRNKSNLRIKSYSHLYC